MQNKPTCKGGRQAATETKIIKRGTLRFVRTKEGNVIDQHGRIFTSADNGRFIGCGSASH